MIGRRVSFMLYLGPVPFVRGGTWREFFGRVTRFYARWACIDWSNLVIERTAITGLEEDG